MKKKNNNKKYFGDVATFSIFYLFNLNYRKFNIYGCDCNYIEDYNKLNVNVIYNKYDLERRIILKPKKNTKDPNHFIDNYFDDTTEYSVPRTNNHLNCWKNIDLLKDIKISFKTFSKAAYIFNN